MQPGFVVIVIVVLLFVEILIIFYQFHLLLKLHFSIQSWWDNYESHHAEA
jgi:hypothetical protein